jgi:hypothetical protein
MVIGSKWINDYQGGMADAILMRLDKYTGDVLQGRYHGTSLYEQAHFVQTGLTGKPYIYGQTEANMPNVNAKFYQPGGGQYISCYSVDLSSVDMQTTFGFNSGNVIYPNISPSAFLVDRCERIFVSGWGGSTNSALYDVHTGTPKQHRNKGRTNGLLTTADAAQKRVYQDSVMAIYDKRGELYNNPAKWIETKAYYGYLFFKADKSKIPAIVGDFEKAIALKGSINYQFVPMYFDMVEKNYTLNQAYAPEQVLSIFDKSNKLLDAAAASLQNHGFRTQRCAASTGENPGALMVSIYDANPTATMCP